ncbi:prepilin-type N-terminal cleavage/methylation domain-containing protein [Lysobacter korlensis]|uniref:Prepilin-type N-terminal cleavage/methylation domain-containing protein n=1 Tax=Lysobacter korlensis TaxID=553636 RepID=A0ABV6RPJ2_9GAMM
MKRSIRSRRSSSGFGLIEVMIAVVVLATGLLALAALQGSLARASGEAKTRGRVAALLTTRMEQLRANQYASAATIAADGCGTDLGAGVDWVPASFCTEAGLGSVTTTQQVTLFSSALGASSFTANRVPVIAGEPEFKRVTLTATWTDASGESHTLAMTSELSALALRDALLPPPPSSGTPTGKALVRTDSPVTAGVVPIATGGDNATAASNPRPEIIGARNNQAVVGTKFEVITYQGLTGAAVIQRRVETQAIKCSCKYGAGGSNLPAIYQTAQWPAIWTGERYDVFAPRTPADAPGESLASGPVANAEQSDLCQECCRDHHDTAATDVPKFDPERARIGQAHSHYSVGNQGALVVVPNTQTSEYVEACRLIRVDGFWRTAADMYSRHTGLLATETVGGTPAKTGVPSATSASAYQVFVKDYLSGYNGTVATAPGNADALFAEAARQLNEPASISIARPSPKDERYLHARGLYVDYLEKAARAKIAAARSKCPEGTPVTECVLPFLPFTTINVTELGSWEPQAADTTVSSDSIEVSSGSSLIFVPEQPTRGRTNAVASAVNGAVGFAAIEISPSNAGIAVYSGVDPDDEVVSSDRQEFVVSAPATPVVGKPFTVQLNGTTTALLQITDDNTTNDPAVGWSVPSAPAPSAGNCGATIKTTNPRKDTNPNPYVCNTTSPLGVAGTVLVSNYGREYTVSTTLSSSICTFNGVAQPATGTVAVPTFANLRVSSATVNGVAGSFPAAGTPSAKRSESTEVSFASIPANAQVVIGFTLESTLSAQIAACTTNNAGNAITVTAWTKPWDAP